MPSQWNNEVPSSKMYVILNTVNLVLKLYRYYNNLFFSDCPALSVANVTVQYDTGPSASATIAGGTVATYSCADGYQLVERRTCLVDGLWSEPEPQCTGVCRGVCTEYIS